MGVENSKAKARFGEKSDRVSRTRSVGCCVGCRDLEPGCGKRAWCEESGFPPNGVKVPDSDLIQDLGQVTAQLPALAYPSINGDISGTTS